MGQHLVYDLNQSTSGTLSIHANRLFKDEENILFDLVDSNNNHITLSIMAGKLKLIFGDTYTISSMQSLLNQTNTWNVITLSWNKKSINGYDVVVWLNNNKVINTTLYPSTTFSSFDVHVGRNSDVTSKYGNCFNGLLEMLVFTDTFISDSVQSIMSSVNTQNKITHEYDTLNLLNKSKVFNNNNEILTNSYEYKELTNDSSSQLTRISTLVKKETINNDVYQYEYDVRGNLKAIKRNGVILHQYTYDELGRLSSSNNEKYIYDTNGNITSVTDLQDNVLHTYVYDLNYSDLLISFDNQQISYDSGNTYNPISIGNDKTLTYKCNKLKTFRDINKGFYNFYYYDDLGNRIKKVRYNGSGTALETIKYYYDDSGKLIYQKVDSYISSITHNESLTFMYDELGNLYGFIYNNEKYYYIKNIFNTILGIVDSTGNDIVKYNYDAWGNILSVEDNGTDLIGSINPFRYKGYYYDSDIEMYYCKARYYVPLWKRWLTPDNPKYLDGKDINNLNLFAYCENNPVMGYDPNGNVNWWKVGAIALAAAAVIAGTVLTVVTYGAGSVAGTIAITAAITLVAKTAEVSTLQVKKSMADGDDASDIFTDVVDAIAGNSLKIIGLTPLTKTAGFASGIYSQSYSFAQTWQLMRLDGFDLGNALGGSIYALKDRFANIGQYMSMNTTGFGYAISYGFAALEVGHLVYSIIEDDYLGRANQRGYKLY